MSSPSLHPFCSHLQIHLWLIFPCFFLSFVTSLRGFKKLINKEQLSIFTICTCSLGLRNLGMLEEWNDIRRFKLCLRTKPITVGASEQKFSLCCSSMIFFFFLILNSFKQWRDLVIVIFVMHCWYESWKNYRFPHLAHSAHGPDVTGQGCQISLVLNPVWGLVLY